jgi:hypothetical protein
MVAVAITAVVIVGEMWLFRHAISLICEGDGSYLRNEAWEVWTVLNVQALFLAWLGYHALSRRALDPPEPS